MRRTAPLALCAAALLATAAGHLVSNAPPAVAKDKEATPAEKDFAAQFASEDAAVRTKAITGLAAQPEAVRLAILSTKVIPKEKRADVLAAAVEVLGRIKEEALCAKVAALARTGPAEQRCLYVESMATMPASDAAHHALLDLLKDKDTWVRAMAAYALGQHMATDALDPLLACLADKQWQVQTAAMGSLPMMRDKDVLKAKAVPELIEFLENSVGRMRDDCATALKRICGRNLGRDPDAWRKWLAGAEAPAPPAPPEGPGTGDPAAGTPPPSGANSEYGNQAAEKPHFYGIDVVSTRVVIVLDVSMSMVEPLEVDKDRLRRETSRRRAATTGPNAPKPDEKADADDVGYDIPWWRIKTKFDFAKYQTINLIAGLEADQNFELILFSTDVMPWMSRLVPANQANKQKAIALLESIKFQDKTNTWGGLSAAFEMSAASTRTGGAGPDEIYFVTDGQPSWGDIQDKDQICEAVLQLAKIHQMRVNVIAIGLNLAFLRKMAVSTGGIYKWF